MALSRHADCRIRLAFGPGSRMPVHMSRLRWFHWMTLVLVAWCLAVGPGHAYFFFLNWMPDAGKGWWDARAVRLLVFLAGFAGLAFRFPRLARVALPVLLAGAVGACLQGLWETSDGFRPLGRDDHPSFLYRLWCFEASRPLPVLYDPWWNGGRVSNALGASGTAAPGLWIWPFTRLLGLSVEQAYTPLLAAYFLLLVPGLAWGSVRLLGGGPLACAAGAVLSLGVHWDFFKYLLHFGTLGSSFGAPFFLPIPGLLLRVTEHRDRRWWVWSALGFSVWMTLAWPVHAVALAALVPGLLLLIPWKDRSFWLRAAAVAGALALWFVPLLLDMMRITDVAGFVAKGVVVEKAAFDWATSWAHLRDSLVSLNPVVWVAGPVGLLAACGPGLRRLLAPALFALLVVVALGGWFSQSLEWQRLVMAWGCLALPVAALALARVLETPAGEPAPSPARRFADATARGGVHALLLLCALNAQRFYQGKSHAPYHAQRPEVHRLADWIHANVPEGRRVMFGGSTGHAFGGGHVAMQPMLSGREMLAADFYHFSPKLVEYYMPPRFYRTSPERLLDYLKLFNVHAVVVWHKDVRKFYDAHPDWFTFAGEIESPIPKRLYLVKQEGTLFAENSGAVRAGINRLDVRVDDPARDAVIRYLWSPHLFAAPPATLEPAVMDEKTTFIRIRPHGQAEVAIRFKGLR